MKKISILFSVFLVVIMFSFFINQSSARAQVENGDNLSNVDKTNISIYLHKGWNLVQGLSGVELVTGGEGIQADDIKAIFGLNPNNKKYVRFYPSMEKEEISNLRYVSNMTFWVYSDKDGSIFYKPVKPEITKFTRPAGWNIISIEPEFIGKSLDQIKGDCIFEKAYWWSPREQKFVNVLNNFTEISKHSTNIGTGLVIKSTNECKLNVVSNNVNILPPPQLPN